MALSGRLRQHPLDEVLELLERMEATGCLTVVRGQLRAEIYVAQGQWLVAERIPVGPPLPNQFVELGLLTPQEFETVLRTPYDQAAVLPDAYVVRALMASGLLDSQQLMSWALADAVALINAVSRWPDGDFSFTDDVAPPGELVPVPLPMTQVLHAASRDQMAASYPGAAPRLGPDTVLEFADVADGAGKVQLSREEWTFLTHIDAATPLAGVARALQVDGYAVMDLAHALLARGIVRVATRAPAHP